jgi:UDP-N-acetylmuramate dehydrogenase
MERSTVLAHNVTSLRVGGPLGIVHTASNTTSITRALHSIDDRAASSLLVLGGGTNVVISDAGVADSVLMLGGGTCVVEEREDDRIVVNTEAGMNWDEFVQATIALGCTGVEMMSGIPGTVGAAPMQNINAYGQQVCDVIESVDVVDRASLRVTRLTAEECGFGFRTSRFKEEWRDEFVISAVRFALPLASASPPAPSTYVDIERYFATDETTPAAATDVTQRRRAVLHARGAKSMLLDPDDPMARSAGSFFVNPLVETALADELARAYGSSRMRTQYLEGAGGIAAPDRRRVPAAHLLRHSGFKPGDRWGRVQLSDRHVLAIVTRDGATATDVWMLASYIRSRVCETTGVTLEYEPIFIGAFPDFSARDFEREYPYEPGARAEPEWVTSQRS